MPLDFYNASQGPHLSTASVKLASSLLPDKGTWNIKVRVIARAFANLRSLSNSQSGEFVSKVAVMV